jgi:hypothetical protein
MLNMKGASHIQGKVSIWALPQIAYQRRLSMVVAKAIEYGGSKGLL